MPQLVCNIKLHIVKCFSDRDIWIIFVHFKYSRKNSRLCRSISIDKLIIFWRLTWNQFLSSYRKISQTLTIHLQRKLPSHLSSHKGMRDAIFLKIALQSNEIQTDLLRNNVKLCTVCDGTVNIHHAGIKTKGSICSYPGIRIYAIIPLEPVTESSNISIFQHTALWHTCGTGSIQKDKQIMQLRLLKHNIPILQLPDLICKQHRSFISVYQRKKLSVSNEKLCRGILHHVHQAVSGIGWIQRLVSCTCLYHAHRCDRHIFTAGDQNGNNIFTANSLGCDIFSKSVADLIQFSVSIFFILKYHSRMVRNGLYQLLKHISDGLTSVIFAGSIIKFRNFVRSISGKNRNFRNIFCFQQGIHSCLIGFQYSTYKGFTVHVTAVFCSKHIFMIVFSYLDQQRHL